MDKLKLVIAALVVVAGVAAYYYFDEWMQLARVGVVIGALIVAAIIVGLSQTGRDLLGFAGKARSEGGKVVWPGRKETTQVTVMVLVMAFLVGVYIYLADIALYKVVYDWILGVG